MTNQFTRLTENQTISSLARLVATQAEVKVRPPDSLDLALASSYDHHAVWGAGKADVVHQSEPCLANQGQQNGTFKRDEELVNLTLSRFPYPKSTNFHVQAGITPSHVSNSKRGFSRGPDGGFYSA